jgi:hypothetical protein
MVQSQSRGSERRKGPAPSGFGRRVWRAIEWQKSINDGASLVKPQHQATQDGVWVRILDMVAIYVWGQGQIPSAWQKQLG